MTATDQLKIGIVGPCAAGKTTLAAGLVDRGFQVRQIAQEHSFVKDMWRQISNPDLLIYLDVTHAVSIQRRPQNFTERDFTIQVERLSHARRNADFYLDTVSLSIPEVLAGVLEFIGKN